MSYILDALKKAEAEREGASQTQATPGSFTAAPVPGADGSDAPPEAAGRGGPALAWAVAGFAIALVTGLLAWMFLGGRMGPAEAVVLADAAPPAVPAVRPPSPAPVEPPAQQAVIEPAPMPAAQDEWRESPPQTEPERTQPPVARPSVQPPVPAPVPPRSPVVRPRAAPAAAPLPTTTAPTTASTESSRVYALQELPESIRRELPQMSVGGAMYSDHPASRMLILNGQPFHEGSQPALNLTLERINLKSAVLSYKGYRYSISY